MVKSRKTQVKIPLKIAERIFKDKGALRVSKEAREQLSLILKKEAEKIAVLSIRNALHFGRKLITKQDVEYALSQLNINPQNH